MPYTAHGNTEKTYVGRGWTTNPNACVKQSFGMGCLFSTVIIIATIIVALATIIH
jgi:hypothetical protein